MSWMRTALVALVGIPATFVLGSWVLVNSLLGMPWARRHCQGCGRFWARLFLRTAGVRVRIEGLDLVDWDEPHILVANHQSWFDVFALTGYLPARYRFAAKEELGRIPIFGQAWKACGHISIARGDRSRAIDSLNQAGHRVREDRLAVVMFPEGTRSPDGTLQTFRKGAFVLAIQTGVDVVPLAISGSAQVMPKGTFRIRPGEIRIRVGPAIPTRKMPMSRRNQLRDLSRQRVQTLLEAANSEANPDTHPDADASIPSSNEHQETSR